MRSLGIDIGGTSAKLALRDDSKTIWKSQSPFYARPTTEQLIEALRAAAVGQSLEADVAGICVPGLLDQSTRTITLSINVPGLMGLPLDQIVSRAFGRSIAPLHIVNDALATAIDVVADLQLVGRSLVIALGTGVGMSVLDDGEPLSVDGPSPGHIGQVDVSLSDDAPIGPDGGAGSLEAYIGVPALIPRFGNTEALFTSSIADAPLRALVRAIRICHAIYRPDHVVLVGGIGTRLAPRITELKNAIEKNLTTLARKGWSLQTGTHDFHAAIGAARLAERASMV